MVVLRKQGGGRGSGDRNALEAWLETQEGRRGVRGIDVSTLLSTGLGFYEGAEDTLNRVATCLYYCDIYAVRLKCAIWF